MFEGGVITMTGAIQEATVALGRIAHRPVEVIWVEVEVEVEAEAGHDRGVNHQSSIQENDEWGGRKHVDDPKKEIFGRGHRPLMWKRWKKWRRWGEIIAWILKGLAVKEHTADRLAPQETAQWAILKADEEKAVVVGDRNISRARRKCITYYI